MSAENWEDEPQDEGEVDFGFAPWQMASAERPTLSSSSGLLAALRIVTLTQHLIVIDDFWTAELGRLGQLEEVSQEEAEILIEAGVELQAGLNELRPRAATFRAMLDDEFSDTDIDRALDGLAAELHRVLPADAAPDLASEWRNALQGYSFREAVLAACDCVIQQTPEELGLIAAKLDQLRKGTIPKGDLGNRIRCGLVLVGAGASVAAAGLALPAVAVAGAATAAIAYTGGGVALWWVGTAAAAVVSWSSMRCSLRTLFKGD